VSIARSLEDGRTPPAVEGHDLGDTVGHLSDFDCAEHFCKTFNHRRLKLIQERAFIAHPDFA
jgi:hypothetical protein